MIEQFKNLPNKRPGIITKYIIGGNPLFVGVGTNPDGKVAEIFIDMNKEGSTMKVILHCFAIAISLGLQYGVPLERYIEIFSGTCCEPNGKVDGHDEITEAKSIIDLIFCALAIDYLGFNPNLEGGNWFNENHRAYNKTRFVG